MTRLATKDIGYPNENVEIDIHVEGEEQAANRVMMDLKDRAARLIQAERDEIPPEECDGAGWQINWQEVFGDGDSR